NFVDTVVAGAVDLPHVYVGALGNFVARWARQAGCRGGSRVRAGGHAARWSHAVQRLRENASARRLAYTAHSGKQEGMGYSVRIDRVAQGSGDVVLTDQILEAHWAPLAGQDHVTHRSCSTSRSSPWSPAPRALHECFEPGWGLR